MESADESSAWHRVSVNVKPVTASKPPAATLKSAVRLRGEKLLNPDALTLYGGIATRAAVLVILAAGKGTRFAALAMTLELGQGLVQEPFLLGSRAMPLEEVALLKFAEPLVRVRGTPAAAFRIRRVVSASASRRK